MRQKKFNFGPVLFNGGGAGAQDEPVARIQKNGQMVISKAAERKYGLSGCLVDIVYDPSERAIGWRKVTGNIAEEKWTRTMRLLATDKNGQVKVALGRILSAIGLVPEDWKGLAVERYQDLLENREVYYVRIPKGKPPSEIKR